MNTLRFIQTVRLHTSKDPRGGLINNQVTDWEFKFSGVLHNSSQEDVFKQTALPIVNDALDGY